MEMQREIMGGGGLAGRVNCFIFRSLLILKFCVNEKEKGRKKHVEGKRKEDVLGIQWKAAFFLVKVLQVNTCITICCLPP